MISPRIAAKIRPRLDFPRERYGRRRSPVDDTSPGQIGFPFRRWWRRHLNLLLGSEADFFCRPIPQSALISGDISPSLIGAIAPFMRADKATAVEEESRSLKQRQIKAEARSRSVVRFLCYLRKSDRGSGGTRFTCVALSWPYTYR